MGATGSIGRQTLDVGRTLGASVPVLAARRCNPQLLDLCARERPEAVALTEPDDHLPDVPWRWLTGPDALVQAATWPVDCVVVAVSGFVGLAPTLAALRTGTRVALANKETLVVGGDLVRAHGGQLVPVDSEHAGVFQLLEGRRPDVRRIAITASGGALRDVALKELADVTPDDALRHPTWAMGPKITIDSATLMNKGFEVLEAAALFDWPLSDIDVALHRRSLVHALVELTDGSWLMQVADPDMRLSIGYAITWPARLDLGLKRIAPWDLGTLDFAPVDPERYPALKLCYDVGRIGRTMPAALNAANEVAVAAFLQRRIKFTEIVPVVEQVLERHDPMPAADLGVLQDVDAWARREAGLRIGRA